MVARLGTVQVVVTPTHRDCVGNRHTGLNARTHAHASSSSAYIDGQYEGSRIHHHSLLAETGVKVHRHREFIQFNKERVYPWYLLAYQRILDGWS